MEIKRENYFTKYGEPNVIKTYSLGELKKQVEWAIKNVEQNNKNPYDIPVLIEFNHKDHECHSMSVGWGTNGCEIRLSTDDYNEIKFVAPDSRPVEGEYWTSRGPSDYDCSGFVVSKLAGERLRRMVRLVLENDDPESWLDYRESEPNWIQFKFNVKEFDLDKLDEMARANNNILTIEILKQCKKTEITE